MKMLFTLLLITTGSMFAVAENRAEARIVSDTEIATPGSTFRVGVHFELPPRSHIYWINPGESGFATEIEWIVEDSVEVGVLQWPAPYQFEVEGLDEQYFGYTSDVMLFADVSIPTTKNPGDSLSIQAKAKWLLCLDDGVCIPEDSELKLEIPIQADSRKAYEDALFTRFAESVPSVSPGHPMKISWSMEPVPSLQLEFSESWHLVRSRERKEPRFFPMEGDPWVVEKTDGKFIFAPKYKGGAAIGGVLVLLMEEKANGKRSIWYQTISAPETP